MLHQRLINQVWARDTKDRPARHLPAIGFAFRRGGRVALAQASFRILPRDPDPTGTGRNSEAGGYEFYPLPEKEESIARKGIKRIILKSWCPFGLEPLDHEPVESLQVERLAAEGLTAERLCVFVAE